MIQAVGLEGDLQGRFKSVSIEGIFEDLVRRIADLEKQLDHSFLVERCMPAVVKITGSKDRATLSFPYWGEGFKKSGSGFFIDKVGLVVTNHHVVDGLSEIAVTIQDSGDEKIAKVLGVDRETDLALLHVEGEDFPYLTFSDENLKIGQSVIALGHPLGFEFSLTKGVVSALGRDLNGCNVYEDSIQTDVKICPGNSGGPLVNLDGEVVGVQSYVRQKCPHSIPFSISAELTILILAQLLEHGHVKRASFGVELIAIDEQVASAFCGGDAPAGFIVKDPYQIQELEMGDLILEYNGIVADDFEQFQRSLGMEYRPFESLELKVLRGGEILTIFVTLGEEVHDEGTSSEESEALGLHVDTLVPNWAKSLGYDFRQKGALVTQTIFGSAGDLAGIYPRSVITRVIGGLDHVREIETAEDFFSTLKELKGKTTAIFEIREPDSAAHQLIKVDLSDLEAVQSQSIEGARVVF